MRTKEISYREIGLGLLILRKGNRYTQSQLGKRLGISHVAVSDMETGKTEITLGRLVRLAEVFNLTPTELLTYLMKKGDFEVNMEEQSLERQRE